MKRQQQVNAQQWLPPVPVLQQVAKLRLWQRTCLSKQLHVHKLVSYHTYYCFFLHINQVKFIKIKRAKIYKLVRKM